MLDSSSAYFECIVNYNLKVIDYRSTARLVAHIPMFLLKVKASRWLSAEVSSLLLEPAPALLYEDI
jgi:hypothetical protein